MPEPTVTIDQPLAETLLGGSPPDRFDVREAWYPVFYLDDLDQRKPARFTLLERDLVIWWDALAGTWRAFDDQCPHRLAPLSEGRVNAAGLLECPYHGWAFSGDGACQMIPQQAADERAETSRRACVAALPTAVCQGLLFVYAGDPEQAQQVPVPVIEPIVDDPEGWTLLNTFRDLPYDALTLLENVLDPSHVPFTHHNTVGKRTTASPVNLQITESGKQGFKGIWPEGPRQGTLGTQYTTFIAPALMWHDLTSQQFGRTLTVVYATPIRKGECRLFARFPFKFSSKLPAFFLGLTPQWYSHISQNRILEDDQIFLHVQERALATKGGGENFARAFYLPTKADKFVFEYRQWVNRYQADPFPGQSFSPRLSTTALMDRYHSHTEHCASCRTALARLKKMRQVSLIGLVALLAVLPLVITHGGGVLLYSVSGLLGLLGALCLGLKHFEQRFYLGDPIPPRNQG
jgi:phenylpropionate dioxygenase-like ring-hydroxylating dioxygenase large terminal subunit